MAKQKSNSAFIKDIFAGDPTGITQAFIMDAIAVKAKEAAMLTDAEVEKHDEKRVIIPASLWRKTGKYINDKMTERYG